jgi:phenylacetaldehyde dehydrogenase
VLGFEGQKRIGESTRRVSRRRTCRFGSQIRAGTACINAHNYGDPAWSFGGYKQSGWGREMGKEVMEHYTETKAVAARL